VIVAIVLSLISRSTKQESGQAAAIITEPSKPKYEPTPDPSPDKDSAVHGDPLIAIEPSPDMAAVQATAAREQRIADLRKQRKGLEANGWVAKEMAKKILRDLVTINSQPLPDPDERKYLVESMDKEQQRLEEITKRLEAIDSEISKEEQVNTVSSSALPTSGVLCSGPANIPQHEEMVFKNLPADRLHLTFDHNAWQPSIHRQADGRQTLIMRSIKPGGQETCDIRWELAP